VGNWAFPLPVPPTQERQEETWGWCARRVGGNDGALRTRGQASGTSSPHAVGGPQISTEPAMTTNET
jgi:hypothetical protein